jgi:hypothetical protein
MRTRALSAGRLLVLGALLATLSQTVTANALFTLKGETLATKLANESEVRVSVLGWTDKDKATAFVDEYKKYRDNPTPDHAKFASFLQQQDTKGYLFTKEASGYTVKYAWQSEGALDKRMVLLVTPALTTRNPYQWKVPYKAPEPFSLIEVKFNGDEALMSTSLDTPIEINLDGNLELKDGDKTQVFARLRDDTPYYLKQRS